MGRLGVDFALPCSTPLANHFGYLGAFGWQEQIDSILRCNQGDQNHKRRLGLLARHRNSPHMAFWRMIKQGYDHFELTHLEPKVDVCEKRYVIGALSTHSFSPANRCPAYEVPKQVAAAVRDKQRRDDIQTTELIMRVPPARQSRLVSAAA